MQTASRGPAVVTACLMIRGNDFRFIDRRMNMSKGILCAIVFAETELPSAQSGLGVFALLPTAGQAVCPCQGIGVLVQHGKQRAAVHQRGCHIDKGEVTAFGWKRHLDGVIEFVVPLRRCGFFGIGVSVVIEKTPIEDVRRPNRGHQSAGRFCVHLPHESVIGLVAF